MNVVYDAGVLVAADRNVRSVWADHRARLEAGILPITTAPVVSQASRSDRQAQLRRFLAGCEIVGFDPTDSHQVGALLATVGVSDVVDGHVAVTGQRFDATVITSDGDDLTLLARALQPSPRVRPLPGQ